MPVRLAKEGGICHDCAVTHCGMDLGPAVQLSYVEPADGSQGSGQGSGSHTEVSWQILHKSTEPGGCGGST